MGSTFCGLKRTTLDKNNFFCHNNIYDNPFFIHTFTATTAGLIQIFELTP